MRLKNQTTEHQPTEKTQKPLSITYEIKKQYYYHYT